MKRIALLLLLVLMAACAGEQQTPIGANPYVGGDIGIEAEFEPFGVRDQDSSLYEIFEGEAFPIEITLKNKGEFKIEPGMVTATLKGINIQDFANIAQDGILQNTESIDEVTEHNLDGGESTLDFTSAAEDAKYLIPISGSSMDVSVYGEVVFEYKTYAIVPQVCYKQDLKDERICDPEETKTVYSSSGPIQVRVAEEKLAGHNKIAMEFQIEDMHHKDDYTTVAKPTEEFDSRFDQLSFTVEPAADWECKSSGKVNEARLDDSGKATIRCVLKNELEDGTLFTRQMDLILHYKYRDLIKEVVRINSED